MLSVPYIFCFCMAECMDNGNAITTVILNILQLIITLVLFFFCFFFFFFCSSRKVRLSANAGDRHWTIVEIVLLLSSNMTFMHVI
jgi:ACR3 family arsenite efflux pump ArsB